MEGRFFPAGRSGNSTHLRVKRVLSIRAWLVCLATLPRVRRCVMTTEDSSARADADEEIFAGLYDAVVAEDSELCKRWLVKYGAAQHDAFESTVLAVATKIFEEFDRVGGMEAASKFILMTEVLTGFSTPEFDFVGERNHAPDFVDIAGKLSAAAEHAIMAEGTAVAEEVTRQQEGVARSRVDHSSQIASLVQQIRELNERLVYEIEERQRLVKQLEENPPERMRSLEIQQGKLEEMLATATEKLKVIRETDAERTARHEEAMNKAIAETRLQHEEILNRQIFKADDEREELVQEMEARHTEAMRRKDEDHAAALRTMEDKHAAALRAMEDKHAAELEECRSEADEAIRSLNEIHNERMQEVNELKVEELKLARQKHVDMEKVLKKELQRVRLHSTEHLNANRAEHMRIIGDLESLSRDKVKQLQLQIFRLRQQMAGTRGGVAYHTPTRDGAVAEALTTPPEHEEPPPKHKPVSSNIVKETASTSAAGITVKAIPPARSAPSVAGMKFIIYPPNKGQPAR